jgi:hypothetical protein
MAVSKRLRYEILRRDSHTCRYCGASAPDVPLRVDHVTPVALGGTDTPDNLVTSCEPCNSGKSSATVDSALVANVSDDALRWANAMKQAADNLREQETPKLEYRDAFLAEWNRWHLGKDDDKQVPLPNDWKQSIERFRVAGIPVWMWADIVDIGMANEKVKPANTFKYCCGIAWNKVTELQAEARRIVGTETGSSEGLDAFDAAIVNGVIALWSNVSCRDPEPTERTELEQSVLAALRDKEDPLLILKAGEWAAYFGKTTVADGFEFVDEDERRGAHLAWVNGWMSTGAPYPDDESSDAFWAHCEALYKAGAGLPEMKAAGFVAGYYRSTVPHYGIDAEKLKEVGIKPYVEQALDIWVRAYLAATGRWPSLEDKRKILAQFDRMTDEGGFYVGDAFGAAVAAGANQEADLYWNLPRQLSAILAAAEPFMGGEN